MVQFFLQDFQLTVKRGDVRKAQYGFGLGEGMANQGRDGGHGPIAPGQDLLSDNGINGG